jgi:hypothetical protein
VKEGASPAVKDLMMLLHALDASVCRKGER